MIALSRLAAYPHSAVAVTRHSRAANRAMTRENRFQELVDSIDGIVWEALADTIEFTFVSKQAERLLGYPVADWLTTPDFWRTHIHPDDAAWVIDYCSKATREHRPHELEYRMIAADGRVVWLRDLVNVTRKDDQWLLRGVMVDITRSRTRDDQLRSKTEQLEVVADVLGAYLESADLRHANRMLLNAAIGLSGSEFGVIAFAHENVLRVVDHVAKLSDDADSLAFAKAAQKAYQETGYVELPCFNNLPGEVVRTGRPIIRNRNRRSTDDGERVMFRTPRGHPPIDNFLGVPMRGGGEVVGFIGVANRPDDYGHDQQAALEALARVAAVLFDNQSRAERQADIEMQLRRAQKMEAIGQLTGGLAHDFNNLLQVIAGNAELLEQPYDDGAEVARIAETIRIAASRGAELTRSLVQFARSQPLAPVAIEAGSLLNEFHQLLDRTLGKHIELEIVPPSAPVNITADRAQLESALLNLALNARDAMSSGGELIISADTVSVDDTTASRAGLQAGAFGRFTVRDSGCGMTADVLSRAFEPFFTTRDVGGGSGLGLAMVYGFAKQSGGHVEIVSEPDQGTSVTLLLPLATTATATPAAPAVHQAESTSSAVVLVVEDEPMVRSYVTGQLRALGYAVLEAVNGPDALQLLAGGTDIHLLFTDIVMPGGMSGRELAARARQLRPGIGVLLTTGYSRTQGADDNAPADGFRVLPKPYRRAELRNAVREELAAASGHSAGSKQ